MTIEWTSGRSPAPSAAWAGWAAKSSDVAMIAKAARYSLALLLIPTLSSGLRRDGEARGLHAPLRPGCGVPELSASVFRDILRERLSRGVRALLREGERALSVVE